MAKRNVVYNGRKRKLVALLLVFIVLSLCLSIERTVIDVFGQMWGTMVLNCAAIVCSIAGLLALCAKDVFILAMYSLWNLLSIGLNVIVILIYHDIGIMAKKEHYLGILVGNENYWKGHGIQCILASANSTVIIDDDYGSGILINDGGSELVEVDSGNCLISYTLIETVHATIYMFTTFMSFLLCLCLVLYPRRRHQITDYSSDEEFSYVSVAQHYDYPDHHQRPHHHRRQSILGFW